MQTILVTGAAGFIGSHTCEALTKSGKRVIGIDNLNNFYDPNIKQRNITEVTQSSGNLFTFYEGDIRDSVFLDEVFSKERPQAVIHLAAYAGVRPSIENPMLYVDVNIGGTMNILEAMRKANVKRHVFASSSSVYGNNEIVPFSETHPVDRAISPYAATKKAGEVLCHTFHHLYGINTACLRFFTVYGPRQRPDLAIHKFTKLLSSGKSIPFFGDGSMQRDHTFIYDILDGILKALDWTDSDVKRYDIFNLGESHTISLTQLVDTIANALGVKPVLTMMPMQPGDVMKTFADISHARNLLGYCPKTQIDEGIKIFVDWFKKQ